jgi:hypothetical protein
LTVYDKQGSEQIFLG